MSLFQEFKKFAVKGNVIDMAVGIIIGAAFTTIVKSLVGDVLMPIIGYFISRKEPSKGLGILITVSGILIIIGGAVVIGNADPVKAEESGRNVVSETMPIIIAGLIQIGLGILKIKKS